MSLDLIVYGLFYNKSLSLSVLLHFKLLTIYIQRREKYSLDKMTNGLFLGVHHKLLFLTKITCPQCLMLTKFVVPLILYQLIIKSLMILKMILGMFKLLNKILYLDQSILIQLFIIESNRILDLYAIKK